jgi:hypothetical protein
MKTFADRLPRRVYSSSYRFGTCCQAMTDNGKRCMKQAVLTVKVFEDGQTVKPPGRWFAVNVCMKHAKQQELMESGVRYLQRIPCTECDGTGKCVNCGGTGKGIMHGDKTT